jgi:hypothetical protein
MRSMVVVAVALTLLVGCDDTHSDALTSERSVSERLKSGDTTVCADPEVQATLLAVIGGREQVQKIYDAEAELPTFSAVNAVGLNKDISEVRCKANISVPDVSGLQSLIALNAGRDLSNVPIAWNVRPALDEDGSYVVEVVGQENAGAVALIKMYAELVLQKREAIRNTPPQQYQQGPRQSTTTNELDQNAASVEQMSNNEDEEPQAVSNDAM